MIKKLSEEYKKGFVHGFFAAAIILVVIIISGILIFT